MEIILLCLACSATGYVYASHLTDGGQILNGWYNFLDRKIGTESDNPQMWLFMPLVGCYKCVTGQMALWSFLYLYWELYTIDALLTLSLHITTICGAILLAIFYDRIYFKLS